MKTVNGRVTDDDLKGNGWDGCDCPGFRSVKRIIPSLTYWGSGFGKCLSGDGKKTIIIFGSHSMNSNLIAHANWRYHRNEGGIEPYKTEPFEYKIQVPDDVTTKE